MKLSDGSASSPKPLRDQRLTAINFVADAVNRTLDLKEIVFRLDLTGPRGLNLELRRSRGRVVRPQEILTAVFGLSEKQIKQAAIIKGKHDVQADYH